MWGRMPRARATGSVVSSAAAHGAGVEPVERAARVAQLRVGDAAVPQQVREAFGLAAAHLGQRRFGDAFALICERVVGGLRMTDDIESHVCILALETALGQSEEAISPGCLDHEGAKVH